MRPQKRIILFLIEIWKKRDVIYWERKIGTVVVAVAETVAVDVVALERKKISVVCVVVTDCFW